MALNTMMHSTTEEDFQREYQYFKKSFEDFPVFVTYFDEYWLKKKHKWCKAWRLDASFHTNNLIETYHNQLKSFYLGRSRNLRVDRLIYMLTETICIDYRQDALTVLLGIKRVYLNETEKKRKAVVDAMDIEEAAMKVTTVDDNTFSCSPFTSLDVTYIVTKENNYIASCSCPDLIGICKHMFLVSAVKVIPFSMRKTLVSAPPENVFENDEEQRKKDNLLSLYSEVDKYSMLNREIQKSKAEERTTLMDTEEVEEGIFLIKNALFFFNKLVKKSQEHPARQV